VLDTLKYATLTGATMDPQGAAEHGKDMLGGILHSEDWRSDRPGLGLGGVLFEAGSAATGLGAAKTGLRGATAAADAGEAGQAARAVAGAESTAPIAGRVSEITGKLDDLSTLADDLPSGAASGSHGPALPPSLTEPSVPRVPEASRLPESPVPQNVSDSAGPRAVPDGPAPRTADSPTRTVIDDLHNPEVRQQSVSSPSAPGFGAEHAGSPIVESPRQSVVATGEGRATEAVEVPHSGSSEASQGTLDYRPSGHGPTSSAAPGFHANSEPRYSAHTLPDGQIGGSHTGHTLDDGPPSGGSHTPTDAAHHDGAPDDAVNDRHHGRTVMTDDLHHPHAGLLDDSEIVAARESPTRVTDALDEGLPSTDPLVRALVPENFDNYGGLTRAEWEARYWPSHEVDVHGNPELAWPDSDSHPEGFRSPGDRAPAVLEPGTTVDRFGPGFGRFVSPEGTPFPERGLPFQSLDDGYHRYEVAKELPVWEGPIAPAMGQSGGGLQYYLPYPVVDLLIAGYIREVI
jgi:Tuberculosis necrotizing toxin